MASIQKPVGLKCTNDTGDVIVVQLLLNKFLMAGCLPPYAQLLPDGQCGNQTCLVLYAFQNGIMGWKKPDMKVDPGGATLAALNGPLKWANAPKGDPVYDIPAPKVPDDVTWGDPTVVTAMDVNDRKEWQVQWGDVAYFVDTSTMVTNTLKVAGHAPIRRLYVLSHGYYDGPGNEWRDALYLRNDSLMTSNVDTWAPQLRKLRPHFGDDADVVFLACYLGLNRPLMIKLAEAVNVPIYGGCSYTWMSNGRQVGTWLRVTPNGGVVRRSPQLSTIPMTSRSPLEHVE